MDTSLPLQAALERLRVEGAIFLRGEYTEDWAYQAADGPTTAQLLHPAADNLLLFHVVARGRCWVRAEGGEPHWADRGDVIVLPYGNPHSMGGKQPAPPIPIGEILEMPPWTKMPVITYGEGGERTDVICGYLHCEDKLFDPELRVFPSVFVVRPPTPSAAKWVDASIEYALESSSPQTEPSPFATRVPELLLKEMLRVHLSSAPAADRGWMAALHDPILAPAIGLLHSSPERKWTVSDLASAVAVSRSVLDERFRRVLGRSPMRYLAEWRMRIAKDLLSSTDIGIVGVARRVGYDAEEAFSRAFKRAHGTAPSLWRILKS